MDLLFALLLKHCAADLYLQRLLVLDAKKNDYFDRLSHYHYLHHAVLTFLVGLVFLNPFMAFLFSIMDYLFHWHIDFAKTTIFRKYNLKQDSMWFWFGQSLDQALHYSTYYLIVLLAL